MCRHRNRKNNYMQLSRFICLSCLHTDTVAINGIQRGSSQREYGHIKDSVCIKCGDVKTMEVRENDYFNVRQSNPILRIKLCICLFQSRSYCDLLFYFLNPQ